MRLTTRTAIAAGLAAAASLAVLGVLFRDRMYTVLRERVDHQLEDRAATAPILAAVGDRLAVSELGATVEGARIVLGASGEQRTVEIGALPDDPLPAVAGPGWASARADGQAWRLYTVEVTDVPEVGDHTLVQLVAPLGDVDALARAQRRQLLLLALATVGASAAVGYGFGALATRPLAKLRQHATSMGAGHPEDWRIPSTYGADEVDDVAAVLNDGLDRLAAASRRREEALESSRSFAAAATHELRTPLTGAITNLDLAVHPDATPEQHDQALADARVQLRRVRATLTALRELSDADLADPAWFAEVDLADQVAVLVEAEGRRHPDVRFEIVAPPGECTVQAWPDGMRVALSNLLRNALLHGRPATGDHTVRVTVECGGAEAVVHVDDNGPGIDPGDAERLVQRFERGEGSSGTGLGLALVQQIAQLHRGRLLLGSSPLGGMRATLALQRRP